MRRLSKNIWILSNPFVLFLPFLLLYVAIVLIFQSDPLWGDEDAYTRLASNLVHGFYSRPEPNFEIFAGPGYPILLAPFIALKLPFIYIKLLNPIFFYLSVVLLYKSLKQIVSIELTLIVSLFWACYYNLFYFMFRMHSEIFTSFLIVLLIFMLVKVFEGEQKVHEKKYLILTGILIGYIALTKVIYGYVILFMFVSALILWISNRKSLSYRKGLFILLIAHLTVAPYLVYTHHLTGRIFYWGITGGNNMYWMTSPHENEYGNWFPTPDYTPDSISAKSKDLNKLSGEQLGLRNTDIYIPGAEDSVRIHHQKDFEEINKYIGVARDDAYKKIALQNLKSHPYKFIQNCISNIERILFNYPNAYMLQKPGNLSRFPLNMIILLLSLFALIPTLLNWRSIPYLIRFMIFFFLLYLGGSVFGSAESRMFSVIAPLILFWIAYILNKTLRINLKFATHKSDGD